MPQPKPYYVYILRCEDDSLYTGITVDMLRRFREHRNGGEKGAKYTFSHRPVKIEALWLKENRSEASKLEYRIKQLSKQQKLLLIEENLLQTKELLQKLQ